MRLTSGRLLCITTFSFFFYSLLAEVKYTKKSLEKIRAKLINKGGLYMLCFFFSFIYCIFFFLHSFFISFYFLQRL